MKTGRRRSRGFSLVEILTAMTIMMMVAATAAALIETSLRVERAGRNHADHEAALLRIGAMFRRDARRAVEATPRREGTTLSLLGPEEGVVVDYHIRGHVVSRDEWQGMALMEHDTVELAATIVGRFEVAGKDPQRSVALVLTREPARSEGNAAARIMRVAATLGARSRFAEAQR